MRTVRIAALADIHVAEAGPSACSALFADIAKQADILVLAGDLTNRGQVAEARRLAAELVAAKVPTVAVLGNHDLECGAEEEVGNILTESGVQLLAGDPCELLGIGFAGAMGFCGGFDRHALAPFGESLIKRFVQEAVDEALRLETGLAKLRTEHKIAVLHYSPIRATVEGEPAEIYPFLGSTRLAKPINRYGVTAVFHGHAHNGAPRGQTLSGTPVYNVALPLLRQTSPEHPFVILELETGGRD